MHNSPLFPKILVANRGEIARRIFAACRELGIPSVAIYSEADADAPWTRDADERYLLPGVTAVETYLNQTAVFEVAQRCGAAAIHPGYGFLSENPNFAQACADHGLTFIGPGPEAMRVMGSKAAAREVAEQAGVPVVPGVDGLGMDGAELKTAVAHIPYPLLIKASAGGGGKGMRVVWDGSEFEDAVQQARAESKSAFGSDHVLVERYFTRVHHVEIQVLGDQQGKVLHLFERECSVQRRHQKIIEESPSPKVGANDDLRQKMAQAAVALAEAVGYVSAGTVEFIVDAEGGFYFLEMNTRLQVEHPVTELVTGLDLAAWQIRIAAGEALPFAQSDLAQRGHALECRVYAEDPAQNFLPSIGEIAYYRPPAGPGIRVDDGFETGTAVSPYYDPMLAKVITWGRDRDKAIRKMVLALRQTVILGVTTNIPYLLAILQEPHFMAGQTSTGYLEEHMADWSPAAEPDEELWLAAAVVEALGGNGRVRTNSTNGDQPQTIDPWHEAGAWRNV